MSKIVKFDDEKLVGKVSEKAFFKSLPEDLPKEVFQRVDEFREIRLSEIMNETMDYAEKHGVGSGEGTGVSVPVIPMGGQATGEVYIDPCFKVTSEVTYKQSDIMEAVLLRSAQLFDQHNNVELPETSLEA